MKSFYKSIFIIFITVCGTVLMLPDKAGAGTFVAGSRTWTALWDSWMGQQIESRYAGAHAGTGMGIMVGPMVGYRTENETWSFIAAVMGLSFFRQEIRYSAGTVDAGERRMDFDFSVNYAFLDHFTLFAGYKLQNYTMEMKMNGSKEEMKMWAHIPTAGLAATLSLSERFIAGTRVGFLYGIPENIEGKSGGSSYVTKMKNGPGFNAEVTLSFIFSDSFRVQGGFRYQQLEVNTDTSPSNSSTDRFYGIILGGTYTI